MKIKHCSECDIPIQLVNNPPRVKEEFEDLCDKCYISKKLWDKFLEEQDELIETLRRGN